jgi:hypothetical protein
VKTGKYAHVEAFCLMIYQGDKTRRRELLWNSRDGVTPFCITSADGREMMEHVSFQSDRRVQTYVPPLGMRIFVDLTQARATQAAQRAVDHWWNHAEHPMCERFATRQQAIEMFVASYFEHGQAPDIVVVDQELRDRFENVFAESLNMPARGAGRA